MLKKRGVFFKRMVLLYAVSTTVIFLFFGAVMSLYEQRKNSEQIRELNQKALFQSASTCTTTLRNLYNYFYMEVLESPELVHILLATQYSQEMSMNFYKLNNTMKNYSSLVESCYVINMNGQFACSTQDTYRDLESFPDQDIISRLTKVSEEENLMYGFIPRHTSYDLNGKKVEKRYISIVFRKYREGYLVINFDYDAFSDMVNYRNYDKNSQTLLLNREGVVMIDSTDELFEASVKDTCYYEKLSNADDNYGVFSVQMDGKSKEICYQKGELFDINYLTITEYRVLDTESLMYIFVFSVLMVIVNLCCILVGTNVLYRPIGKLSNLLKIDKKEEKLDEFKMLEKTFWQLKQENKAYDKTKREKVLRDILEDKSILSAEMQEELQHLQEDMSKPAYVCVNIYPERSESSPYEISLLLFSAENILAELTENFVYMQVVNFSSYMSCIFNIDPGEANGMMKKTENSRVMIESSSRIESLELSLKRMQDKMKEYFDTDVTCAVGNLVNSIYDLSESFRNVQIAAFFQFTREKNAVLYWEELPQCLASEQNYPGEIVKNLLEAIKNCEKGKIRTSIQEFFVRISNYSYTKAVKCIFMLEIALANHEMKYDIQLNNDKWEMVDMVQRSGKLYRIQECCLEHCLKAAEVYQEIKDNNPNMKGIVDKVMLLVNENITSSELTVSSIAESVHISNSYLRNIFKEVTGGTLSNYIIERKLEKICELLEQTEMSTQQIADAMGVNSKSYLFTFFKNYMGMTPTQYRNQKET